jgi:hypothetical protein
MRCRPFGTLVVSIEHCHGEAESVLISVVSK